MKFATTFLLGVLGGSAMEEVVSSALGADERLPLHNVILECQQYMVWRFDSYFERHCTNFCYSFALNPAACGWDAPPTDANALADCIFEKNSAICRDTRSETTPVPTTTITTKASTIALDIRKTWIGPCAERVYAYNTEDWDELCKGFCEYYSTTLGGWRHCNYCANSDELAYCVHDNASYCKVWEEEDPSPEQYCLQTAYLDDSIGPDCMSFCEVCKAELPEATGPELVECVKDKGECPHNTFMPSQIPNATYADNRVSYLLDVN